MVARHEIPDDAEDPQAEPRIPEALLKRLEQQGQSAPVYRVGRDGVGHLERPEVPQDPGGDLTPLLMGMQEMFEHLLDAVDSVPDIMDGEKRRAERFDLSTRLAIVHAGNTLDYALRRVEDIARTARIAKLRHELAQEMKAAGLEGDPRDGMTQAG